MKILNKKFRS